MKGAARAFLILAAATLVSGLAQAHDFWLVPVGDEVEARTGDRFPTSTDAIDATRLVEASAVSVAGKQTLTVIGQRGKALVLRADMLSTGVFYAIVTLAPREIRLDAKTFNAYLQEDGLPHIYADRRAHGELGLPAVERYQKFAKALLLHRGSGSTATAVMGQPFEIIAGGDPTRMHVGDTLTVEVRFEGRPMAALVVTGGWQGQPTRHAFAGVTDARGRVSVPLRHAGLWYLRTIHMRRVNEANVQYESFWASLTFPVR